MDRVDDVIAHFGVKGMKWGQRQSNSGGTSKRQDKKDRADWLKTSRSAETANAAFQDAVKTFSPIAKKISNDPRFKGKDLTKDAALGRQYDAILDKVFNDHLATASINKTLNKNGRAMVYQFDRNSGLMSAKEYKMVHGDTEDLAAAPVFQATFDSLGHVVALVLVVEDELKQSDDVDDVLLHYGVKGMKWGRRGAAAKSGPTDVSVSTKGTKLKTSGGEGQPAAGDAVNAAVLRQKAKKSGVSSLSNNDLQAAVKRMQLEQQFSVLKAQTNPSKVAKGQRVVKEILGLGNTANQAIAFNNSPAGQELRKQFKEAGNS